MEISILHSIWSQNRLISTDTRKVENGSIFFALKGEKFDGNTFASLALENGASYVVVDDPNVLVANDHRYIVVDDVLKTLQALAHFHRNTLDIPVLAITGSNGKTTTKELCRNVLCQKYRTYATFGNLNNHIGVPLTILSVGPEIEFLIVEMGANHQGEISDLCEIATPNHVMITNIGKAHLEGFGGEEGIKIGKSEMYRYAERHHAKIFINNEDKVLSSLLPKNSDTIIYNVSEMVQIIHEEPSLILSIGGNEIATQMYGSYNLPNIAFAMSLGKYFGVEDALIHQAISTYVPDNNRSQLMKLGTNTIIKDAYNANPSSMQLSLTSFSKITGDKVVVLGDMLELGDYAEIEHSKIIQLSLELGFQDHIFVGKYFKNAGQGQNGNYFDDVEHARVYFQSKQYSNCSILLKGSRGIAIERIL